MANFPEIKIQRTGLYSAMYINGATIDLTSFRVTMSHDGEPEITVSFKVPVSITEFSSSATQERNGGE